MARYEPDNLENARRTDKIIREDEASDPNVHSSMVPGRRLHAIIHNLITEGIGEG